MTTVSPTTDQAAALAAASASTNRLMADTQDRFLSLLITQLRNQDPLNPMDNAEVTSQIAQLSTVNGINQLNNTLLALSGQLDVSQSMQAAGLIGKSVLVPGSKVLLGSAPGDAGQKQATPLGVDVIGPAAQLEVTIFDAAGQPVRKLDMGAQPPGVLSVQWDGRDNGGLPMTDGAYTAQVNARDAEGNPVPAEMLAWGQVSSVDQSAGGLRVDLGLGGQHSVQDIRKIM